MTTSEKNNYIQGQITELEKDIWKLDSNAKALAKAGLKDRAEAIAKQSAECSRIIDAFREQISELNRQ